MKRFAGLLLLFAWCVLLRLPATLPSVIDWDESIYLIVADQWDRGYLPYVDAWDHKPLGIYVLFRMAFAAFGKSVPSVRILSTFFVFLSACLLYLLTKLALGSKKSAVSAAILYPALSLMLGGTAANTELFFITFNLAGAWLLLRLHTFQLHGRAALLHAICSGLLFGIALQVKYVAIFESALFVGLFLLLLHRKQREVSANVLTIILTAAIPTVAAGAFYWLQGYFDEFWYANFGANLRYLSGIPVRIMVRDFLNTFGAWLFAVGPSLIAWTLVRLRFSSRPANSISSMEWMILVWLVVAFLEASVTRRFFPHYLIPTFAPVCLLLACAVKRFELQSQKFRIAVVCGLFIVLIPIIKTAYTDYSRWIVDYARGTDHSALIAKHVNNIAPPPQTIYVANEQPVIYFLTGAELPTRFILPIWLVDPISSVFAGADYRSEYRKILARSPRCIVIRPVKNERITELRTLMGSDYALRSVVDSVEILCATDR